MAARCGEVGPPAGGAARTWPDLRAEALGRWDANMLRAAQDAAMKPAGERTRRP
jgi:hypothetical protein